MVLREHFLEFMSRPRHERIVLRSSFPDTRFDSPWSIRHFLKSNGCEQFPKSCEKTIAPKKRPAREKVLDASLDAQRHGQSAIHDARLPHQAAKKIVCQYVRPEFLLHHIGAASAQDIHLHRDFHWSETAPSPRKRRSLYPPERCLRPRSRSAHSRTSPNRASCRRR